MLKKTITYKNLFDDSEITEDFWFHLSAPEAVKLELSAKGGISDKLKKIVESGDAREILETFESILEAAYGRRSEDGKRFEKSPSLWEEFKQTNAYEKLFFELVTDATASSAFVKGILPADLLTQAAKKNEETPSDSEDRPAWIRDNREPTSAELQSMTKEQMMEAFRRKAASIQ